MEKMPEPKHDAADESEERERGPVCLGLVLEVACFAETDLHVPPNALLRIRPWLSFLDSLVSAMALVIHSPPMPMKAPDKSAQAH